MESMGQPSRRAFLKRGAAATGAAVVGLSLARSAHAFGSDVLKVGLIGCGGRGSGAAGNALSADPNTKLVAMGDAFADRLDTSRKALKKQFADQVDVPDDRCFVGFDCEKKVIDCCDVVLLAQPPHFRPAALKAAIDAGKHVFAEKPVAVDAPGIRSVLESAEKAKQKGLSLVSGLCWRYDPRVKETMKRVLDGSIGDIVAIQETYLTGELWQRERKPDWTEMEFQLRNWLYFSWLSGDFNNEQHVHSLDKASWAMHDEPPVRAWGLGGRQVRTDPKFGDIYDHHAVVYEYANGTRVFSFCRQQKGCYGHVDDIMMGTKGQATVLKFTVEGQSPWKWDPKEKSIDMYKAEHIALFESIRSGKPINNGVYMARSTMLAILGRMVNYTGKNLTWDEALASDQVLAPDRYAMDGTPPVLPGPDGKYPVAMPGVTPFVGAKKA